MLDSAIAKEKAEPPKKRGRKPKVVQETLEVKKDVAPISNVLKDVNMVIDAEKKTTSGSDKEDVDANIQPKKRGRAAKEAKAADEEPVASKVSKTAKKLVTVKEAQDPIDEAEKKQVSKKQKKADIIVKADQEVLPKTSDTDEQNDKPGQSTEIVAENVEQPKKKAGRPKKAAVAKIAKTETKNAKESQAVKGESSNTEAAEQVQPKKKGMPKKAAAEVVLNPVTKDARATKKPAAYFADSNSESSAAKEGVDSDYEPEKKTKGGKTKVMKEKNKLSGSDDVKKVPNAKVALEPTAKPSEKANKEPAVASKPVKPKAVKGAQSKKVPVKKPPAVKKNKTDDNQLNEEEKQEDGPGVMDLTYDV